MAVQEFTPEELATEEWRPIAGYEGIYSVSNLGRVRRDLHIRSHVSRIRKACVYKRKGGWTEGYVMYALSWRGEVKRVTGARLVLTAFVGACPAEYEANHIDGETTNNRLTNLEWVSRSGNQQHAIHVLHHVGSRPALSNEEINKLRALFTDKMWAHKRAVLKELASLFNLTDIGVERIVLYRSCYLPRKVKAQIQ